MMICVKLGISVYDVYDADDFCKGLNWVLHEDVVNNGVRNC